MAELRESWAILKRSEGDCFESSRGSVCVVTADGEEVAEVLAKTSVKTSGSLSQLIISCRDKRDSRARLIAAAPELATALKRYLVAQKRMLERWAEGDDAVKQELWRELHACEADATTALAKARGGQHA